MPTLALIDGNSIAYRAFYALPEDLATKSGQVTNAVFGFTRMLIRLLKDFHPDGIAVAWDVSRKTFRTEVLSRSTRRSARRRPTTSAASCLSWTRCSNRFRSPNSGWRDSRPTT